MRSRLWTLVFLAWGCGPADSAGGAADTAATPDLVDAVSGGADGGSVVDTGVVPLSTDAEGLPPPPDSGQPPPPDSGQPPPDAAAPPPPDSTPVPHDAVVPPPPDAELPTPADAGPLGPEVCFVERFGPALHCYPGCAAGGTCHPGDQCRPTASGDVCVPDCRTQGCAAGMVCAPDTGDCRYPDFMPGQACDGAADCANCCNWALTPGEDNGDPGMWWCEPPVPGATRGTCNGEAACDTCIALPGTLWLYGDDAAATCDFSRLPGDEHCVVLDPDWDPICWSDPGPPVDTGRCILEDTSCWSGACGCVDGVLGLCLFPLAVPAPPQIDSLQADYDPTGAGVRMNLTGQDTGRDVSAYTAALLDAQGRVVSNAQPSGVGADGRVPGWPRYQDDGRSFQLSTIFSPLDFSAGLPPEATSLQVEVFDAAGATSGARTVALSPVPVLAAGENCTLDRFAGICAPGHLCEAVPDAATRVCEVPLAPALTRGAFYADPGVRALGVEVVLAPINRNLGTITLDFADAAGGAPLGPAVVSLVPPLPAGQYLQRRDLPDGSIRLRIGLGREAMDDLLIARIAALTATVTLEDGLTSEPFPLVKGAPQPVAADAGCTQGPVFDVCPEGQFCGLIFGDFPFGGQCAPPDAARLLGGHVSFSEFEQAIGVQVDFDLAAAQPTMVNLVFFDAAGGFVGVVPNPLHWIVLAYEAVPVSVHARTPTRFAAHLVLDPHSMPFWPQAGGRLQVTPVDIFGIAGTAVDFPVLPVERLAVGAPCLPGRGFDRCDPGALCLMQGGQPLWACTMAPTECAPGSTVLDLNAGAVGDLGWHVQGEAVPGVLGAPGCGDLVGMAVARFTAPADGVYQATQFSRFGDNFPLVVRSHCGIDDPGAILACDPVGGWARVELSAGETVYFAVMRYSDELTDTFDLTVVTE